MLAPIQPNYKWELSMSQQFKFNGKTSVYYKFGFLLSELWPLVLLTLGMRAAEHSNTAKNNPSGKFYP